jgi:hypothetical protein
MNVNFLNFNMLKSNKLFIFSENKNIFRKNVSLLQYYLLITHVTQAYE